MTKLGVKRIRIVRCRGGNLKHRALRLETGSFAWGAEAVSRKARIMDVVYNASNNELVRTKTLVKNAIVEIDAAPFRTYYESHYNVDVAKSGKEIAVVPKSTEGMSESRSHKYETRQKSRELDDRIKDALSTGRLLACISSRPGQSGRADGYVLEGAELGFYARQLQKKKGKK